MIFIYPTDTAYAIGCDARDKNAVERIFEIKERDESKPLPLIASNIEMARQWCELAGKAEELAVKHWPGPLTLALPVKKHGLSDLVASSGRFAVRVPDSRKASELSSMVGAPIASTSANLSGDENSYSIKEVKKSLGKKINLVDKIIDAGELPKREPSTIVKIENNKIKILRRGAVRFK